METLDWLVIGIFFLALIGIIVWVVKQKQNDSADYFLGGRDATWLAIGASIFASNIGSEHLIGLAGAGASSGMAMAHWEIQGWMILILGWVFVPFYSRSMVYTMPEFLERRYNPQSRTILSVISLVSYVLTKVAVTVYAGGLVFQQVFGIKELWGIDFFWIAAIGLVVLTALYTIFGGMKSVLYTSVLQTPILLLGSLIILVLGFKELGGWDEMMKVCGAVTVNDYGDTMTNLIRSNDDPNFPWLGALIGSAIIGFWYWCTDQFIVQRVLSGKDETQARRGAIFGAYLKLTPVFLFLIPGMVAFAMQKHGITVNGETFTMSSADAAFPTLVAKLLPAGFKGLVVCGILAALMSSLASLFNSSAMLFTIVLMATPALLLPPYATEPVITAAFTLEAAVTFSPSVSTSTTLFPTSASTVSSMTRTVKEPAPVKLLPTSRMASTGTSPQTAAAAAHGRCRSAHCLQIIVLVREQI